jgi:aminopeptidase N
MASTQFEALDARRSVISFDLSTEVDLNCFRAFPCWDEPAVKTTFSVTMIVASHLTALSNMPGESCKSINCSLIKLSIRLEIQCQFIPGNKKKITFEKTPKMSTYLLAWAVGKF